RRVSIAFRQIVRGSVLIVRQNVKHRRAVLRKPVNQHLERLSGDVDTAMGDMLVLMTSRLKAVGPALGWSAQINLVDRDGPVAALDFIDVEQRAVFVIIVP